MIKEIVNCGGFILLSAIIIFIVKLLLCDSVKEALKFTGISILMISLTYVAIIMMTW